MMSPTAATEIESSAAAAGVGETLTMGAAVDDSVRSATALLFLQAPLVKMTAKAENKRRRGDKNFREYILSFQKKMRRER